MRKKKSGIDVADVETLLRLIQFVPSKKAEPIKLWLARVGYERIEEINNSEKALNRSRDYWQKMGRSRKFMTIRKELFGISFCTPLELKKYLV